MGRGGSGVVPPPPDPRPILSDIVATPTSPTEADVSVTTDIAGGVMYFAARLETTPSLLPDEINSGSVNTVELQQDASVTADDQNGATFSTLQQNLRYYIDVYQVPATGPESYVGTSNLLIQPSAGDVDPPAVDSMNANQSGHNTATLTAVNLTEDATDTSAYVMTSTPQPNITKAQVLAGTDENDQLPLYAATFSMSAATMATSIEVVNEYVGNVYINSVLADISNNVSDPVQTPSVAIDTSSPAFAVQPTLDQSSYTVGQTVTRTLGAGLGANTTVQPDTFYLGNSNKESEVDNDQWDTAGEPEGTITYRTRVVNTISGKSTTSDTINAQLALATVGGPSVDDVFISGQDGLDGDIAIAVSNLSEDAPNSAFIVTRAQPTGALTAQQIAAGTDENNQPADDKGSFSVTQASPTANLPMASGLTGLYYLTFTFGSVTGDLSAPVNGNPHQNTVDTTGPGVTAVTGASTGQTTASWGATSDEAGGTMFAAVRLSSNPQLTKAEIENGTGNAVATSQDTSPTADDQNGGTITGLTAGETYHNDVFQRDAAGQESTIATTSAPYTTDSGSVGVVELAVFSTDVPGGSQLESAEFTPNGTDHIVIFACTASAVTSGDILVDANTTVGAQGRAFGTGTPLIQQNMMFRSRVNNFMIQFGVLPATPHTFQFEVSTGTPRAYAYVVLSVPGGSTQNYERTGMQETLFVTADMDITTLADNSFLVGCIATSASADNVYDYGGTVDGEFTKILTGAGGNTQDINMQAFWKQAGAAGPDNVTATWGTAANLASWTMEIEQ